MLERDIYHFCSTNHDFEVGFRLAEKDIQDTIWVFRLGVALAEIEHKFRRLYTEADCAYKLAQLIAYRSFLIRHARFKPEQDESRYYRGLR